MVESYCLKEKKHQTMNDAKEVTLKNGRKALNGTCNSCGSKLFKFIKS